MDKLYIVYGMTGEYSDRGEWNVAAYANEAMACEHAEAAKRWYQEHDCYAKRYDEKFENPFDPDMYIDYTGTDWSVIEVKFRTSLPTEQEKGPNDRTDEQRGNLGANYAFPRRLGRGRHRRY